MAKKAKKSNKIVGKLFAIVCISITIIAVLNVAKMLIQMVDLKNQKALVEEELAILKDENETLNTTKSKLEDPNYVQTYARGEYMFSKSDEKVFYLPSSEDGE